MVKLKSWNLDFQNINAQVNVESALAATLFDLQNVLSALTEVIPEDANLATAEKALYSAAIALAGSFCEFYLIPTT